MARIKKTKKDVTAEEVQDTLQIALDVAEERLQKKIDTFAEDHNEDIENLNKHKVTHYILHIITFAIATAAHLVA